MVVHEPLAILHESTGTSARRAGGNADSGTVLHLRIHQEMHHLTLNDLMHALIDTQSVDFITSTCKMAAAGVPPDVQALRKVATDLSSPSNFSNLHISRVTVVSLWKSSGHCGKNVAEDEHGRTMETCDASTGREQLTATRDKLHALFTSKLAGRKVLRVALLPFVRYHAHLEQSSIQVNSKMRTRRCRHR